ESPPRSYFLRHGAMDHKSTAYSRLFALKIIFSLPRRKHTSRAPVAQFRVDSPDPTAYIAERTLLRFIVPLTQQPYSGNQSPRRGNTMPVRVAALRFVSCAFITTLVLATVIAAIIPAHAQSLVR